MITKQNNPHFALQVKPVENEMRITVQLIQLSFSFTYGTSPVVFYYFYIITPG